MNRFDRAMAILLLLRNSKIPLSAAELSRRLEVSKRTIYRDVEALAEVGVPVYAEAGRDGGFKLMDGYFISPIAFSVGEATSLLIGLALLDRLRAKPFANELEMARQKLLAVVPDYLHDILRQAEQLIGFEDLPYDVFHPEPAFAETAQSDLSEAQVITVFLQGILECCAVEITYYSPYGKAQRQYMLVPNGIIWDRNHWYLAGQKIGHTGSPSLWRADRVMSITRRPQQPIQANTPFQVTDWLGRKWLDEAISNWAEMSPVVIRMTPTQAERLRRDWYFGHAQFETVAPDAVLMRYGEGTQAWVFELLRWLGHGAELVEPHAWREAFIQEMQAVLQTYQAD
ncbi:MAG: WYL domain-containing protein [Chloroflexi bacterium]|nr:WYL domain-containing protein [Chloroflexota bacterium]